MDAKQLRAALTEHTTIMLQRACDCFEAEEKSLWEKVAAFKTAKAAIDQKELELKERERVVGNRERAQADVNKIASDRLAKIKTLEQNQIELNNRVAEAEEKTRKAETQLRKLAEGLEVLKTVQEQA